MLNDPEIRKALIDRLLSQSNKPKAVIEELQVCNGRAIADIVALYSEAHCYEIKGANDKVGRILSQGEFYNAAFRKITLVTTENHLEKALDISPSYWGIMIAKGGVSSIRIRHIRGAELNPYFDSKVALLTLWKSEMLHILNGAHKQKPRDFLAQLISETKKKADLSNIICESLFERHVSLQAT